MKKSRKSPRTSARVARDTRPAAGGAPGANDALFRTFSETITAAIFIYQGTRFRYVNLASESLTGYTCEELLRMNFWDLVHPDYREVVRERGLARQSGKSAPQRYEFKILTKSGEERWVDFTASQTQFEGQPAALGTVFDITELKRAAEAQRRSAERLEGLQEIERAVLAAQSVEEIARVALARIGRLIPYQRASAVLFDFDRGEARFVAVESGKTADPCAGEVVPLSHFSPEALHPRNPVCQIEDAGALADPAPMLQRMSTQGIRSILTVPLVAAGKAVGEINLASARASSFSSEDVAIATEVAAQLSVAIQNAQLLEAEKQARHAAEALRSASLALTETLDLEAVLETLLTSLQELIPYDSANIMLLEDAFRLKTRAVRGYRDCEAALRVSLGTHANAIIRQVMDTRRSVVVPDATMDSRWEWFESGRHVRNWMGVPLFAAGKMIGLFSLDKAQPGFFTEEHLRWAEGLAGQAAVAIQNAQLYAQAQQYAATLEQREIERRQTEEALRESEAKFRALTETTASAIFISRGDRMVYANRQTVVLTGYPREELLGRSFYEFIHPAHREMVGRMRAARLRGEPVPSRYEFKIVTKGGEERWIDFTATVVEFQGEPAVLGTSFDITERKGAEQLQSALYRISQAALSSQTLEELFRSLHEIVGELMPAQNFYVALYHPAEECISFPYFVDEADPKPAPKKLGRGLTEYVLRTGTPLLASPEVFEELVGKGEVELIGAPSIDWLGVPLQTADRKIGVLVVQSYTEGVRFGEREKDILQFVSTQVAMATERKRAEEALRASEERYRELIENANDIIYTHDLDGNFTSLNATGQKVTGYSHQEITRLNVSQILTREQYELSRQMTARGLAGESRTTYEMEIAAKDGRKIALEVSSRVIFQDGKPVGVQGIARDVTDRKRLEDQLRQAQKMEAVGRLAGGIAHDFNNLLGVLMGYSEIMLDRLEPGHPMRKSAEEIGKATQRAASLTRQLLAFSRKQVLAPKVLDLNAVLSEMESLLRRLIREDVELRIGAGDKLGRVKADRSQLEQVVLNLALNARDAMPRGGKLTIETANIELDGAYARRRPVVQPGRYVMMAVSDTGVGMDADTQAHVFEPFFTTKEKGKGTGLGLATVYGIVKQSGGYIWVYSEPGIGTTFKVYLPRVDEAVDTAETAVRPQAARGKETILLVEDEDGVREVAREFLESFGYTVLDCSGPREALYVAEEHKEEIHLLLTDVVMPEMGGRDLAERVKRMRPLVKVLFMSGYTDDAIVHHGVLDANVDFLQKPFARGALERKVREVLDGGAAASAR